MRTDLRNADQIFGVFVLGFLKLFSVAVLKEGEKWVAFMRKNKRLIS